MSDFDDFYAALLQTPLAPWSDELRLHIEREMPDRFLLNMSGTTMVLTSSNAGPAAESRSGTPYTVPTYRPGRARAAASYRTSTVAFP